jgi:hypothetical protein
MSVLSGDTRKKLAIEPEKVYPEMFDAIEYKDWEKYERALKLLSTLIKEIDKSLKIRLEVLLSAAFYQHNVKMAERNTYRLIFCSVKVLLSQVLSNDTIDKKEYTKQALRELETLQFTDSDFARASFSDELNDALDNLDYTFLFEENIKDIIAQIDILKKV